MYFDHLTSKVFSFFHVFWTEAPTPNGPESQPGVEEDVADKEEEGSEDEWEQVGPRNKTSITRQADFVRTPITDIFGGHIRYDDRSLWNCFRNTFLCEVEKMSPKIILMAGELVDCFLCI